MELSIVIPTHRRAKPLARLLTSVAIQDFSRENFEIIVVSNLPDPDTKGVVTAFAMKFPNISYQVSGQIGVNYARNAGLRAAKGALVLFLDDDCEIPRRSYFRDVIALHQEFSDVTAIGGGYVSPKNANRVTKAYQVVVNDWMNPPKTGWMDSWKLVGGNVSYKKTKLVEGNKSFDERIIFGGAETEFHQRLLEQGHKAVLHSTLNITHHCKPGLFGFMKRAMFQGVGAGRSLNFSKKDGARLRGRGVLCFLYDVIFEAAREHGQRFDVRPGRAGPLLLLHVPWLISVRFFRSVIFPVARRVWSTVYWTSVRAVKWVTYTVLIGFIYYKIMHRPLCVLRSYVHGVFHLFFHWTPDPWSGPRPKTPMFAVRFLVFLFRNLDRKGSKTSLFLHTLWRNRENNIPERSVHIPWSKDRSLIFENAKHAQEFGFNLLTFSGEILVDADSVQICSDLRQVGFEIEVYYRSRHLRGNSEAKLKELENLAVKTTFVLDGDKEPLSILPERFAIGPGVTADQLRSLVTLDSSLAAPIKYVDFLHEKALDPLQSYRFACETATDTTLEKLRWTHAEIFQPFFDSSGEGRFRLGKITWSNEANAISPEWSVIIPCYENSAYLPLVVEHIFEQIYARQKIEVIVVDDGSRTPIHESAGRDLRRIRNQLGFSLRILRLERDSPESNTRDTSFRAGLARNAGILHSSGRKIFFVDSDILLPRDHFRKVDGALETADVVQSVRQMLKEGASSRETKVHLIDLGKDVYREDYYWEKFKRVEDWNSVVAPWKYVCTYALAMRRETLEKVKFFRPEFSEYGFEDVELGYRIFRLGARFHLLKSPVFHLFPVHRSIAVHFDEDKRFRSLQRTARLFYRMHTDPSIFFELRSYLGGREEEKPVAHQADGF